MKSFGYHCGSMRWTIAPLLTFAVITGIAFALGQITPDLSGWRPAVCDGGQCFCEAARPTGWAQPSDTYSNLGYVLAGLLLLGYAAAQPLIPNGANLLRRTSAYANVFGLAIIAIGLGSLLFHGTLTFAGQFTDLLGMYLFSNLLLVYNLARLLRLKGGAFAALYVGLTAALAALLLIAPDFRRIPFAAGVAAALILEVILAVRLKPRMQPAWLLGGLASFGLAYVAWTLDNTGSWCDPTSWLQGHALWHLFGALASGLAVIYYWREENPA